MIVCWSVSSFSSVHITVQYEAVRGSDVGLLALQPVIYDKGIRLWSSLELLLIFNEGVKWSAAFSVNSEGNFFFFFFSPCL